MDWVVPLVTLTAMEIVLGIDNIVFISILCGRLPPEQRTMARFVGLGLAMVMRILLLFSLSWVLSLTNPVFELTDLGIPRSWVVSEETIDAEKAAQNDQETRIVPAPKSSAQGHGKGHVQGPYDVNEISVRDLILLFGGLFLIYHSVVEIHHKLEGEEEAHSEPKHATLSSVLFQITMLDIIFSLDSVITAVGMAKDIWVMVTAVVISVLIMMIFAGAIERFVSRNPTIKMLALSFLILIGVLLVADGIGTPFNKGYVYFAMAFSLAVEMINLRVRGTSVRRKVVS